jgi:uncharacterized protein involved in exopolysaccharide biosynthesis
VLSALQARAAELRAQLVRQRERQAEFNPDQERVTRLQREVDLHEAHYRKYADNLQQLQVDSALATEKLSNISIVQPATYDAKPVRPDLLVILGIGFLFALAGSAGLAFLCERLSPSPQNPDMVPKNGLPVTASVPHRGPATLAQPQES